MLFTTDMSNRNRLSCLCTDCYYGTPNYTCNSANKTYGRVLLTGAINAITYSTHLSQTIFLPQDVITFCEEVTAIHFSFHFVTVQISFSRCFFLNDLCGELHSVQCLMVHRTCNIQIVCMQKHPLRKVRPGIPCSLNDSEQNIMIELLYSGIYIVLRRFT